MTYVDLTFGGGTFRGRLLGTRSPGFIAAFEQLLPIEGRIMQDDWSGDLAITVDPVAIDPPPDTQPSAYQYPGLLVLDPDTHRLALVYGPSGRLRTSAALLPALPIAEFGGDLAELNRLGRKLEFDGAGPLRIARSADQRSPLVRPAVQGRRMKVTLGRATVTATLLEDSAPLTSRAFAALLPIAGFATNVRGNGPLIRFWNDTGSAEGETPIDIENNTDPTSKYVVLVPGYLYYTATPAPARGLRIPFWDAAAFGMPREGGPGRPIVPFARLEDDWEPFAVEGSKLRLEGQKPMRFELA